MVAARCPIAVLVESFPKLSETFVASELDALGALGHPVRVEARERSLQTNPEALGRFDVAYAFEDSRRARLAALVRLVLRHPLAAFATSPTGVTGGPRRRCCRCASWLRSPAACARTARGTFTRTSPPGPRWTPFASPASWACGARS